MMKARGLLLGALAVTLTAGCDATWEQTKAKSETNEMLVRSYQDDQIRNAIIAQHTIYAYHFIENSAELNALGEHDLGILIEQFKEHAGLLNLRRGAETVNLHEARVQAVVAAIKKAGITGKMTVSDGLPGGDGAVSERVIRILAEGALQPKLTPSYD